MSPEETVNKLDYVHRWIKDGVWSPKTLKECAAILTDVAAMLNYYAFPKNGFVPPAPRQISHVNCSVCGKSSQHVDACLLLVREKWYCRICVPRGDILPTGYQPSLADQDALDKQRQALLKRIDPKERHLINRNIVR